MDPQRIEPLQEILSIYDNKEKALLYYLDDHIVIQLDKTIFYDERKDDLFLNDIITCINKRTLELEYKGRILSITDDKLSIKKNKHHVHLVKDDYYIFYKRKKTKNNQADFYKALLECL